MKPDNDVRHRFFQRSGNIRHKIRKTERRKVTHEVKKKMEKDPGVKAGVFVYEIHVCRSIFGDS